MLSACFAYQDMAIGVETVICEFCAKKKQTTRAFEFL